MFKKWLKKLEERVTQISGSNYTPEIFSLEWGLVGISHVYGFGVSFRLWLYQKGLLKQKKLPCFVISIGNIVVGGAGKTPMAIYVAKCLTEMGKKTVVVSRGYKGTYKNDTLVVSDGDRIFSTARESGDEPDMMARRRAFPVVVGKDRFKAGMVAIKEFNPDVIVLDDGFQHLNLKRDLDLLLLDCSSPLGNQKFLPAGRLRETVQTSAKRADALVFTRCPEQGQANHNDIIEKVIPYYPDQPWFKSHHAPFIFKRVVQRKNSKEYSTSIDDLRGKRALLFSGLANNRVFSNSMKASGINVLDHLEFKDHYRYKEADILRINASANKVCADMILTTEKDWTKLEHDTKWALDVIVIGIEIEFEEPKKFEFLLNSRLKKDV